MIGGELRLAPRLVGRNPHRQFLANRGGPLRCLDARFGEHLLLQHGRGDERGFDFSPILRRRRAVGRFLDRCQQCPRVAAVIEISTWCECYEPRLAVGHCTGLAKPARAFLWGEIARPGGIGREAGVARRREPRVENLLEGRRVRDVRKRDEIGGLSRRGGRERHGQHRKKREQSSFQHPVLPVTAVPLSA